MTLWTLAKIIFLPFLQLANDLRDSALISNLHVRLRKMASKVDDIHKKVDDTHHKVEDIHTILFKLKRSGTRHDSDPFARQEMPLKPEIFHGRDDMVEGIAQLLLQVETSRVCILGPGGMGKTSVSLAVVELPLIKERFSEGNIVWVPCIEATSASVLLEIMSIQLQIPGDKEISLEKIISELNTLKQPRLIVVDNFETPWNGGNQKQVGDILRRLAMLSHIAILVTMRGRRPPCYGAIKWQSKYIESTDEEASLWIYHDIYPDSKNDPDVAKLLSALGHMPFAVTLIANLGAESRSSAKDLLDSWSESGTKILSNDPEQSMDQSIRLSVESDLVKRNPDAFLLLAVLSLLPAGTTNENLRWWAPAIKSTIPSAIATLSQAALLVENRRGNSASPVLFVVPVVQSFMQQQNRIPQEVRRQVYLSCCEYVLTHACRHYEPTFNDKSKALAAEDTNIHSILFGLPSQLTIPSHRNMEAFIAFNWYRCDVKPNLEIADHAVMAAKTCGVERYVASAVWCLGVTYYRLGIYDISYNHMQEAYHLFNTLPPSEVESQRLGGLCGIDVVEAARFNLRADEVVSLALEVEEKCSALADDVVHGSSLLKLGIALHRAKQRQKAFHYMDHARTVFKAVGDTYKLARAYYSISCVHLDEHRFSDALDAIEEAWKYAELTASQYIQMTISLTFCKILFLTNQDAKAWKRIEITLINASYIEDRHQVALALEYMGYGYLRRGDYQNAYGAYEAAAEKYSGTRNKRYVKDCEGNMANIKVKQGNPDAVVGFYRPLFDFDETLFYPPVQPFAIEPSISHS